MSTIFFDSRMSDETGGVQLYQGDLFVFSPTKSSLELCGFAVSWPGEAFAPFDPRQAQHHLAVEKYVEILAMLKPKFIHHPTCKELIRAILSELGCDTAKSYFDVPRLRTMTHDNYLAAGLAYAFHPHRDTWFSAPSSQLNWWIPVYDIRAENTMAFLPKYWSPAIRNTRGSTITTNGITRGRRRPRNRSRQKPEINPIPKKRIELESQIRLVCKVGGIVVFSGAQMHSTVPNTSGYTRFSIDFRSVHLDDVVSRAGAPNIDAECTGTTLRDFLRADDLARLPEEIAILYDQRSPPDGELVFSPEKAHLSVPLGRRGCGRSEIAIEEPVNNV